MRIIFRSKVKNNALRRILDHSLYITVVLVLIPTSLYHALFVVLPTVVEQWSAAFVIHLSFISFLFMNILGNMIYGILTNTTTKGINFDSYSKENWTLCAVCECLRPPRSWHCEFCDACILKRDHHCTFMLGCVGYFNYRYFFLFTFYIFIGGVYGIFYQIIFISTIFTFNYFLIIKFIFPLVTFVFDRDQGTYILLVALNTMVVFVSGFLIFFHLNNILKGRITHEVNNYTKNFIYNKGWKQNLIEVFGNRWYLSWISPFIESKLPGNGIEWPVEDKCK